MRAGASWRQRVFLGALPSTADDARVASVSRRQIDVSVGSIFGSRRPHRRSPFCPQKQTSSNGARQTIAHGQISNFLSPASGKLLKPAAPNSSICRPTVPTSIRSKTPSPSSRRMCGSPPREPSIHLSEPPPMPCNSSNLTNAQTSSFTPDTAWIKRNLL
jgi:hypothetical protein